MGPTTAVGSAAAAAHCRMPPPAIGYTCRCPCVSRLVITNQIVLAEFGRFPLQIHFWQQILRYHNRVRALPNSRLDKLALIDGYWDSNPPHRVEALSGNWRSDVRRFTDTHGQQIVYDELDISIIVEREKARWVEEFLFDTDHSSLQLYRTVYKADHSVYQYS